MSSHTHFAWSTENELAYIATLGQTSEKTQALPRQALLANYFHAMRQRKNWEGMNRTTVMKAIHAAMVEAANAA
jgi:hypothetical protein